MPTEKFPWNKPGAYRCSKCEQAKERDDLVVRRVQYLTMGKPPKTLRSRVDAWLCRECAEADPAWQRPLHSASPGLSPFMDKDKEV
jgi:hypothetical protein